MHLTLLQQLGLAKNEARIYVTLVEEGELSVGTIAVRSHVHRRNVYDSLARLIDRALVFEVPGRRETRYRAAHPEKLLSTIAEKRQALKKVLPDLLGDYESNLTSHQVYIYRGYEGWKNYMRDMLRVGEPAYFIGAKGAWLDPRVNEFFPKFINEAKKKKMKFYHLFDYEVQTECPEILEYVGTEYKFLPQKFSTTSAIDIFGDHVNLLPELNLGAMGDDIEFVVLVNRDIADSFRTWFRLMWDFLPDA